MIDIREGDVLVVGSKQYPVKSCAEWAMLNPQSGSYKRMATVTASTLRSPVVTSGKRAEPATHLTGLKCTPLDPVSSDIQRRVALDAPMELLQTFATDGAGGFVHLVLEDLKRY